MEKLDAMSAVTTMVRPKIDDKRRRDGHASRMYSVRGAMRYMPPEEQVPIAAMPLGCCEKGRLFV